ncbi:TolC family protein [Roseimaritima ulvae]|uniref:TolC family protein n=1 Tax=Roseimaritima ulvae TaxID=980254 RepID=UPI00138FAD8C|nr:TolC family protein [Roseimaritima ulvae]
MALPTRTSGIGWLAGLMMLACGCASHDSPSAPSVWQPLDAVPLHAPVPKDNAAAQVRFLAGESASPPPSLRPRNTAVEPTDFVDMTRQQVIETALRDSRVIRDLGGRVLDSPSAVTTRYDFALQQTDPFYGPQAALAEFDTVLNSSLTAANNDRVFNNAVLGGGAQELLQDTLSMQSGLSRRLPGGGVVSLDRRIDYDNNNRSANLFPSVWETQMEVGIRQPLLRGAGRQYNAIAGPNAQPGFQFSNGIVIARMNSQISLLDFERALQDFVSDVEDAYWTLQLAYREYEGKRVARDAAYQTWQAVKAKADEGLAGGEADKVSQAQAKYLMYRYQTLETLNGTRRQTGVLDAERRLRFLIGMPTTDGVLIRPVDRGSPAPLVYDWEAMLAEAMGARVDLRRQAIRIQQEEARLLAAKNFLLPQLDVIGRYRLRGFGDDLTGDGPRFASAYDDFFSLDHQEWEFGVEMQMAAGRRQARAAVQSAKLKIQRERAVWDTQQRLVTHELSEAVARVEVLQAGIQLTRQRMQAAEQRLQATRAQYDIGQSTVHLVLDAQEDFIEAQQRFIEASTDYAIAIKNVSLASGCLLRDRGVRLAETAYCVDIHTR